MTKISPRSRDDEATVVDPLFGGASWPGQRHGWVDSVNLLSGATGGPSTNDQRLKLNDHPPPHPFSQRLLLCASRLRGFACPCSLNNPGSAPRPRLRRVIFEAPLSHLPSPSSIQYACVKAADGWPVLIFPFPVWPQAKFGIDEQGVITDQTAHTAALAEVVANAKKSWPELLGADAAHAKCGLVLL